MIKAFFMKIAAKAFLKLYDMRHGMIRLSAYSNVTQLPLRDVIFNKDGTLYKDILYYPNGNFKFLIKNDPDGGKTELEFYENGVMSKITLLIPELDRKPFWFTFSPEGELCSYRASYMMTVETAQRIAQGASTRK